MDLDIDIEGKLEDLYDERDRIIEMLKRNFDGDSSVFCEHFKFFNDKFLDLFLDSQFFEDHIQFLNSLISSIEKLIEIDSAIIYFETGLEVDGVIKIYEDDNL